MDHYCTLTTEYRGQSPYYTVYDYRDCIVVFTSNYKLADHYFRLCSRGHTARTLYILAQKGIWPRCA